MPYITRVVGALVTSSNPSGAKNLVASTAYFNSTAPLPTGVGDLDDASNLILAMTSSAGALTSSGTNVIKVSLFDPFDSTSIPPVDVPTTEFFTLSLNTSAADPGSPVLVSSGLAYLLGNVAFRGVTVNIGLSSGNTDGEIVAWVMKQITV